MIKYLHNTLKYSIWCKPEHEELLDEQIKNADILIVGLTWCPWTRRAKNLISDKYNIDPVIIAPDIFSQEKKVEILHCLSKKVGTVYVPQIWIKGKHIGNYEHLHKMAYRKQIDEILNNKTI